MAAKKRTRKTQRKAKRRLPKHLAPGNPGNSGGKKGRSGRPPKAFTKWKRDLYDRADVRAEIEAVLLDRADKHFAAMHKALIPQEIDVTTGGQALPSTITVRLVKPK